MAGPALAPRKSGEAWHRACLCHAWCLRNRDRRYARRVITPRSKAWPGYGRGIIFAIASSYRFVFTALELVRMKAAAWGVRRDDLLILSPVVQCPVVRS